MSKRKAWIEKRPETNQDWLLLIAFSIVFYLVMGNLPAFGSGFQKIMGILTPFAGGVVIAYVLDPIARASQKYLFRGNKKYRGVSILLAYVAALLLLGALVMLVVPQVKASVMMLVNNASGYVLNAQEILLMLQERFGVDTVRLQELLSNYNEIIKRVTDAVQGMVPQIIVYAQSVVSNTVSVFTAIASSIYILSDKDKLLRQLRTMTHAFLPRNVAENVLRICGKANENFTGFFTGKIIDSTIIGIATFVVMGVLGLSFAPLISVVIGVTNIIPVFGPFIGAVPSIVILLLVEPLQALEFLVLVLVLQQVDGNFLGPKILGQSIGISALWVLFSIVVGGDLLGIVGMVIGVPVFATFYGLMREFVNWCLKQRGVDADGVALVKPTPKLDAQRLVDEDDLLDDPLD